MTGFDLRPGETVLLERGQHRGVLALPGAVSLAPLVLACATSVAAGYGFWRGFGVGLFFTACLGVPLLFFVENARRRRALAVTDRNVRARWEGDRDVEVPLAAIEDATARSGAMGRRRGYGTLSLRLRDGLAYVFRFVPAADEVARRIREPRPPAAIPLTGPACEPDPALPAAAPPTGMLAACPDCGGKVSVRAATCPHCGAPLRAVPAPIAPSPTAPVAPKRPRRLLRNAVGCVTLLILTVTFLVILVEKCGGTW